MGSEAEVKVAKGKGKGKGVKGQVSTGDTEVPAARDANIGCEGGTAVKGE